MKKKKKGRSFVMLERQTLRSSGWKELTPAEKLTYIGIKANFNGGNNGEIPFKYSESDFRSATTSKALKGLIEKGWIEKTKHGGLYRYFCLYKLTGKCDFIR
jgi:hypothetical protein